MTYRNACGATPTRPRSMGARRIVDKLHGLLAGAMPAHRPILALMALLCAGLATTAAAEGYSRAAELVLARAFAATGGSNWYLLRGWRETGRQGGVAYESWIDPVRYGVRTEMRDGEGLSIHGFNGQADWRVGSDGMIAAVNDHASLARARTEAFFAVNGYFFRGRFDASGDYVGVRSLGGRSFDVVRILPGGGEPRELWFDQKTRLLARIVDRNGRHASALKVTDYRKVGPVRIPFRITPEPGSFSDGLARQRESLAFEPVSRDLYSLNRPQELARVAAARASPVEARRDD